ncbi:MAG TPA: cytochrome c-type biogenesis protein CcmH [Gemmatimonadales bacterium]|jgi:cytochrome c-type biogenesis protein CcmH|nr:cytochrome c-type biogenesis protein CcmH [Gemmatimonadales bacterium]
MSGRPYTRRDFLRGALVAAGPVVLPGALAARAAPAVVGGVPAQDSLAGRGAVGTLRDPSVVGRPHAPTDLDENAAEIQAIELRLACNCGCTLDVFTCRTTDFSCTYSPKLHREVLALRSQGKTAQEVLDAFVAQYGEKALMAPKPKGFNLAGYLVPGTAIAIAGAGLMWIIGRRRQRAMPAGPATAPEPEASPEEMERLRRALAEVED